MLRSAPEPKFAVSYKIVGVEVSPGQETAPPVQFDPVSQVARRRLW